MINPSNDKTVSKTQTRSCISRRSSWTKAEIRNARKLPLRPILKKLGYLLERQENGNYLILNMPEKVIIKENYWVNHEDSSSGNAIDFFIKLCGKSFSETMTIMNS